MGQRDEQVLKSKLARHVLQLLHTRAKAALYERAVVDDLVALTQPHGSAKRLADTLSVSGAYMCDVCYGRRGIGDATLEKLAAWLRKTSA